MHNTLESLREMIMRELDEIVQRGEVDEHALHCIDKFVDIVKDIDEIGMGEEGYSQGGRMGYYPYAMDSGNSYRRGGYSMQRRDSMGRYSRDDGYSGRDNYSRGTEREEIMAKMGRMMDTVASETERQAIQRIMNQL